MAQVLAFDNWTDPDDFYTMSIVERRKLLNKFKNVAVPPTMENQWIWFGTYDTKNYPKFSNVSVAGYLYQVFVLPHNNARIRGVLNNSKSDVNPFKYFKASVFTKAEILKQRAAMMDLPLEQVMTPKQNEAYETKVSEALEECKEYYMVGSPTTEAEFMRNLLIQNGHMPIAVDEAMKRSALDFK